MAEKGRTSTQTLKAHDKLLFDVIKRQAGTLKKAITEGTMNSIEAGTPEIIIKMWQGEVKEQGKRPTAYLQIVDKGIGIRTKQEIVEHFETFGQPHEEHENTTWKQFRMGRGQMFAFGENTWRTSQFEMLVDINEMGLDYVLTEGLPEAEGCTIDIKLYENPIGDWQCRSIEALREEVQEQVRYVSVPVLFNDKQISVDPAILNWDFEDDDAYYLFNDSSSLKIYNLGIYTKDISRSQAGVGGIIVSKKQLKVNFARNDVQSDCEVFKRIRQVVQANKLKKASKTYRSLGRDERYSLLRDFRDASVDFSDLTGKRIFGTAQGKWLTWNMIMKSALPWTFAKVGDRTADRAMERGVAMVLSQGMLDELSYSGDKDCFFDWIMAEYLRYDSTRESWNQQVPSYIRPEIEAQLKRKKASYVRFSDEDEVSRFDLPTLSSQFDSSYSLVPRAKWTKIEKRIISALEKNGSHAWDNRKFSIGISGVASAWTDGGSYIALERSWLKKLSMDNEGCILKLFSVITHELAHDCNTAGTHHHGPEFYERFHELVVEKSFYSNPLFHAYRFKEQMVKARIEEKKVKEAEKEQEAMEKLGVSTEAVAASSNK